MEQFLEFHYFRILEIFKDRLNYFETEKSKNKKGCNSVTWQPQQYKGTCYMKKSWCNNAQPADTFLTEAQSARLNKDETCKLASNPSDFSC